MICFACGQRGHQSCSCPHRGKTARSRGQSQVGLPIALTSDEIDKLAFKVKENRQLGRSDLDALIAMARERNALIANRPKEPQSDLSIHKHPWGSP